MSKLTGHKWTFLRPDGPVLLDRRADDTQLKNHLHKEMEVRNVEFGEDALSL